MMKITNLGHSGFLVELNNTYLIFDYFIGNIPKLNTDKRIYVFSSHVHEDHFNINIFNMLKQYKGVNFILSNDIHRKYNNKYFLSHSVSESQYNNISFLTAGASTTLDTLKIDTLKSTDEGVAFIVEVEGKTIYHAGDLNLWIWQEEGERYNKIMTAMFEKEMKKIKGQHFDLAFLVLDSRQGNDFYLGFDYFMKNTDTDLAYAMHFCGDSSVVERLKNMPISDSYKDKIYSS